MVIHDILPGQFVSYDCTESLTIVVSPITYAVCLSSHSDMKHQGLIETLSFIEAGQPFEILRVISVNAQDF